MFLFTSNLSHIFQILFLTGDIDAFVLLFVVTLYGFCDFLCLLRDYFQIKSIFSSKKKKRRQRNLRQSIKVLKVL